MFSIVIESFIVLFTNVLIVGAEENVDFGTTLYTLSDVKRKWTDAEGFELQCRMLVGSLVPTMVPENADDFLTYFVLIKNNTDKISSVVGRKRAMVIVADAIGGYLYTKMLPQIRTLYYEGKLKYTTAKRLHDIFNKIKYVLATDGRGWARPVAGDPKARAGPEEEEEDGGLSVAAADQRCGGADAGPYGLTERQWRQRTTTTADDVDNDNDGVGELPLFDNDTRPHSLVVPWRPGRPALFRVQDAGCHRALFDHCSGALSRPADARDAAATAAAAAEKRVRALRAWVDAAVSPLVTPEAAAAGHWYPALWGASLAARRLDEATAATGGAADDGNRVVCPTAVFYAYIVLASASVCSALALFSGHRNLRSTLGRLLCVGHDSAADSGRDDDDAKNM